MQNVEVFNKYLEENKIPFNKYSRAYHRVKDGLKPRYFRFPYKKSSLASDIKYKRVKWLRDVDLFEIHGNESLPENAMGLDAASASVVESLRLSLLAGQRDVSILDMCCAPGGKLLATASALGKYITSDNHKVRIIGLDRSLRRLRICNAFYRKEGLPDSIDLKLICVDSTKFDTNATYKNIVDNNDSAVPSSYDRVIVDVECSHEGSLRSVLRTLKYWGNEQIERRWVRPDYIDKLVYDQVNLLTKALDLCKPGGIVIYSTCSLINRENQGVVNQILRTRSDVYAHPLPTKHSSCSTDANVNDVFWPAKKIDLELMCKNGVLKCAGDASLDSTYAVLFDVLSDDSVTDGQFIACLTKLIVQ